MLWTVYIQFRDFLNKDIVYIDDREWGCTCKKTLTKTTHDLQ